MRVGEYLEQLDRSKATVKALLVLLLLSALGNMALLGVIVSNVRSHTYVLVPSVLDKEMAIVGGRIPEQMLGAYASDIAHTMYSYNPFTARLQFSRLLHYFDPERYREAEESLAETATQIETLGVTSYLHVGEISYNPTAREPYVRVKGMLETSARDGEKNREERAVRIMYRLKDGRFYATRVVDEKDLEERGGL